MLYQADTLLDVATVLQAVSAEDVYHRLRDDAALRDDTQRLRRVKQLDAASYARLKTRLPFVCCARFRDGIRRTERFEQTQSWVLDVDKYGGDAGALDALRARLCADERVWLLFVSPGGDGLKLFFRFDAPCTDTKQYSDAYKGFAYAFGEQYGLTRHIDFRTIDVARVCFLAHDPGAYINPLCEPVSWAAYMPQQPLPMRQAEPLPEEAVPALEVVGEPEKPGRSHAIHPDTYAEVLRRLKVKARPNPLQRPAFVPEAVQLIVAPVTSALLEQGIEVAGVRDIQYGKQLALRCGHDTAELNLYFGSKGFSVVPVPKRNTNESLARLAKFVVEQYVYSRHVWYTLPDGSVLLPPGEGAAV